MSDDNPLPPELVELLRRDPAPRPPADFDARLLARLESTLGGAGAAAAAANPPGAGALSKMGSWGIPVSVGTLVLGAAVGLVAGVRLGAPEPTLPVVAAQVAPPVPEVFVDAGPAVVEPLPQVPPPIRPVVKPPDVPKPVSGRDVALADERALVEMARTAFARGDKPAALAALEQHSRRFPRGQLSEERESLRIQAWVQSGRFKEARAAAEAFQRSFPDSMLLPLVEEALQAIGDAGR